MTMLSAAPLDTETADLSGRPRMPIGLGLLLASTIMLMSVQDFAPGQNAVGRAGAVIATPFALALFVLLRKRQPVEHTRLGQAWRGWLLYALLLGWAVCPWLPTTVNGTSPAVKGFKLALTFAFALCFVQIARLALAYNTFFLRWGLTIALAANSGLLYVERHGGFGGNSSASTLHITYNIQQRPRLLTPESSEAGALIIGLAAALLIVGSRWQRWSAVACLAFVVPLAESRGSSRTVLAVAVLLPLFCLARRLKKERLMTGAMCLATIFAALAGSSVIAGSSSHSTASSDATRSIYVDAARYATQATPVGSGFSGSLVKSSGWLDKGLQAERATFTAEGFQEIDTVLRSESFDDLSPKTLPGILLFPTGLVGLALLMMTTWVLLLSCRNARTTAAALLLLVAVDTYVNGLYNPELPFLAGLILGWRQSRATE